MDKVILKVTRLSGIIYERQGRSSLILRRISSV